MEGEDRRSVLHVPARDIPIPHHLGPQAQMALARQVSQSAALPPLEFPPLDAIQAWRTHIAAIDAVLLPMATAMAAATAVEIREKREEEALAYDVVPRSLAGDDRRVYLDIHGGGLIAGSGEICRAMAASRAEGLGARVVSVDYRMPPDHPYPAALDDCLACYRALLREHRPGDIIVGGGSAGGNLAAATILRARDEGLPLPAAAVLISPELDLTESGDSFRTNLGLDGALRSSLMLANLLYAGGRDLAHPYLSPLFGDFSKGFPPTYLSAGTRDLFLSNAVRMHRALRNAGIVADLHVQEAAGHGGFGGGAAEDAEIARDMRAFCEAHWRSPSRS